MTASVCGDLRHRHIAGRCGKTSEETASFIAVSAVEMVCSQKPDPEPLQGSSRGPARPSFFAVQRVLVRSKGTYHVAFDKAVLA